MKIFYVDQLEERGSEADTRVLDYVASADAQTAQCLDWIATLEDAVRSTDPAAQQAVLLNYEEAHVRLAQSGISAAGLTALAVKTVGDVGLYLYPRLPPFPFVGPSFQRLRFIRRSCDTSSAAAVVSPEWHQMLPPSAAGRGLVMLPPGRGFAQTQQPHQVRAIPSHITACAVSICAHACEPIQSQATTAA